MPGEQPGPGRRVVKLNTNENPYPPSPRVLAALNRAVDDRLRLYPDPEARGLRMRAAAVYGVPLDHVLAGNGSDECLTLLMRAIVDPGDRVAFPVPTYSLYDTLGLVEFAVQGGYDSRHRPTLKVDVSGVLHLKCQRCLGQLDFPLRLASTLLLANAAEGAALDDEECEWIEASPALDVESLVEDEIILGLPYSPRHAEDNCPADRPDPAGDTGRSAFAKLAALRRNLN